MLNQIKLKFLSAKDEQYAIKANAYLLNQFKLLGLYTQQRKLIVKPFLEKKMTKQELIGLVNELWHQEYRDFKYVACSFLKKNIKLLSTEDLDWLQSLVLIDSWWDTVDSLVPIIGKIVKGSKDNPMDDWIAHENFWIRRVAIIHQLGFKVDTDISRLSKYALSQSVDKEFFIRKAIGWAFRDYARYDSTFVLDFMNNNKDKFSNLTYREAMKHIV